jgi:hypothetical protein
MRSPWFAAALLALLSVPALAGDGSFDAIVRGVESDYGVHRAKIPMFGLARFAIKTARPEGVKDFDMAILETKGEAPPDGSRFAGIVEREGGGHWSQVIRVHSRRDREWTYSYAREQGRDLQMLIATFEPGETVILHARVNLEVLARACDNPEHAGNALGGGR